MNLRKKAGRPKKENGRSLRVASRLNNDEMGMLLFISNETGKNYSDVIREAIRYLYYDRYFDDFD